MSATFTLNKNGYVYVHLSSMQASTFHTNCITLDEIAAVAEADSIIRENHTKYLRSISLPKIGEDWTEEEELEWDALFAQPNVQAGLNRLAEEVEQQLVLGEFEEGGFAVE